MTPARQFLRLIVALPLLLPLACGSSSTGPGSSGVASVAISPSSASVVVGGAATFTATAKSAAGDPLSGISFHWSTQNPQVATVDGNGNVTGIAQGSTQVSASANGQSAIAAITVTPKPVASVTVSPAGAAILVGQTVQLQATTFDAQGDTLTGRAITWSSSQSLVASVNSSGLVTGLSPGSTVITATSEGKQGNATVVVSAVPVASVQVQPTPDTLILGDSVQLTATTLDSANNPLSGRTISWASSNTGVAIVTPLSAPGTALVFSRSLGSAAITATSEGKTGSAQVTVIAVPVAAVTVSPASATIFTGDSTQLTATLTDRKGNVLTGRPVTWASDNTAAATVSASGMTTGVGPGVANISATSGGKTGTSVITVVPVPVASVVVSPASSTIGPLAMIQLTATPLDASGNALTGRAISWSSNKTNIATVDSTGLVRSGIVGGTATITAVCEGVSGKATVKVSLTISSDVVGTNQP